MYSDVILLTAQTLINNPDIPLDQFRATQEHAFGKNTAEYSVLRSIAIAWLYDSAENTREAVQKYILHEEKEEWYTKFGASPPSLTAENPVVFSEHHHPKTLKTL